MSEQARSNGETAGSQECPHEGHLTLDKTHMSWGLGRVCLGCARPVTVTVEHYR